MTGKYLVDEAADGDHGKAGMLELGKLVPPERWFQLEPNLGPVSSKKDLTGGQTRQQTG